MAHGMLAEIVDPIRLMLLNHVTLAGVVSDDTGEPPMKEWIAGRLYVYEADDADEHELAGVGPQDRERFEVVAAVVAPKRGEGVVLKPGRPTSLWLDERREAILECVRRNRSRWGTVPGPPAGTYPAGRGFDPSIVGQPFAVGQPCPWQNLEGRADVRFARIIETRLAAVRISGWRILPNEEA